ncbi:MAG: alpha/beta hydrolase [Actinobacteria bacterium]|nr:alpha/beta hydrolase [Actinomycetota bacterium]
MTRSTPRLPPLSPDYAAALEGFPPLKLSAEVLADARPLMAGDDNPVLPSDVTWRDVIVAGQPIPGGERTGALTLRLYERTDQQGDDAPRPAMLWIHGGGYVMGSYRNDADLIGPLVAETGVVVAAIEYSLAPESPYPTALEECYGALNWLRSDDAGLSVDPDRIGIAGLSAGGGLCAALAILARDRGEIPISFVVLDSPMLDDRRVTVSSRHEEIPLWTPESNVFGWASYLGDLSGRDDVPATAAPARCTDLGGLPPTLISVGAVDGFRDEDIDYATRLSQAGVPCELHVYPGAPHGYRIFGATAVTEQSRTDIVRFVARQIA